MDKIKLVLIDELMEDEEGWSTIPSDCILDSVVQLGGLVYAVLYRPNGLGGICGCAEPEPELGVDRQPSFPF